MLSALKVMCANHSKVNPGEGQCDWIGEYGAYQDHIRECKNEPCMALKESASKEPKIKEAKKGKEAVWNWISRFFFFEFRFV